MQEVVVGRKEAAGGLGVEFRKRRERGELRCRRSFSEIESRPFIGQATYRNVIFH